MKIERNNLGIGQHRLYRKTLADTNSAWCMQQAMVLAKTQPMSSGFLPTPSLPLQNLYPHVSPLMHAHLHSRPCQGSREASTTICDNTLRSQPCLRCLPIPRGRYRVTRFLVPPYLHGLALVALTSMPFISRDGHQS